MNLTKNSNDRQTTLTFTGALDLHHARQAHQALAEAIRLYSQVAVKIREIETLDLSFIQLICGAHRTVLSLNKRFTISFGENDRIRNLLLLIGFQDHCGCGADADAPCIWQTALFPAPETVKPLSAGRDTRAPNPTAATL